MKEMVILAPLGMLGYGFPESSLNRAMERNPDVIAVDAGSTDPGPFYLGAGVSFTSKPMVERDLRLILGAARKHDVPLVIGSAGGGGGRPHLNWLLEILRDISVKDDHHFRLAVIDGELDRRTVRQALRQNKIHVFESGRPLTEKDVDDSVRIVAQMGHEPIGAALRAGAEVVVAGRAWDAGLFAALPLTKGFDPGLAFHLGKIVECGAKVAEPMTSDSILGILRQDEFILETPNPSKRCSAVLTAAHTLYEKVDPYRLPMPGGFLDLGDCTFEELSRAQVRVRGSRFVSATPYTVKLEGVRLAGYRTLCIAGLRDPIAINNLGEITESVRKKIANEAGFLQGSDYKVNFWLYGINGVMGDLEPTKGTLPYEVGVVIEAIGPDQDTANAVCALARSGMLHWPYTGRIANAGNLAFPFSPSDFPVGPAFEFNIYHLMDVDDPVELFPTQWETVGEKP